MFDLATNRIPTLDFKLADGTITQIALTGPIAATFLRDSRKALGTDHVTREMRASWEADPAAQAAFLAKMEQPNECLMVSAVDALLTRDAPDLRGRLPLALYGAVFFEALEKIHRSIEEEGVAGAESKKATSSPR